MRAPRPVWLLAFLGAVGAGLVALLLGLGIWQVQRLSWKLDLIARVDARLAAGPVAAPGPGDWPAITRDRDEYRRVTVTGRFDHSHALQSQAVTAEGGGFWLMTPLITDEGWSVLVNRGFVPGLWSGEAARPDGPVTISGLLRMTEPKGGFLRENDPVSGRWFSRDVAAMAVDIGMVQPAPYFIDASAGPDPAAFPKGGLTVVSFRNSHLVYAVTWFVLAAAVLAALIWVGRYESQLRRAWRGG